MTPAGRHGWWVPSLQPCLGAPVGQGSLRSRLAVHSAQLSFEPQASESSCGVTCDSDLAARALLDRFFPSFSLFFPWSHSSFSLYVAAAAAFQVPSPFELIRSRSDAAAHPWPVAALWPQYCGAAIWSSLSIQIPFRLPNLESLGFMIH
jgi:hypothetical protein